MAEWLQPGKYADKLIHIRNEFINHSTTPEPNECDHGKKHCKSIQNQFGHLVTENEIEFLSEEEKFFLLASPWILNLAWTRKSSKDFDVKQPSYESSYQLLHEETIRRLLGINNEEANIFQHMVYYYDLIRDLEKCPGRIPIKDISIRVRLLTAYLRLADAIHVDSSGGPTSLFYFLENQDSPELFHWCKGRLKPMITTNPENKSVAIHFGNELKSLDPSKNVIRRIVDEIEFHVIAVKNTLVSGGITAYLNTELKFYDKGPFADSDRKELEKLLKEFSMSFPPNAGMLQKLYLESIETAVNRRGASSESVEHEITELQNIATNTYDFRPLHVGLARLIHDLNELIKKLKNDPKKIEKIKVWAEQNRKEMKNRLGTLFKKGASELVKYNRFIVFGFSSTVIGAMAELQKKLRDNDSIEIYVCEAHNKSRYDSSGRIRYIDGANYSAALKKHLSKANVTLIPDITIASTLKLKGNKEWAVLFGANGITRDGKCGHTAGHLSISIVANHFKIPVYILCDTFKIGNLDFNKIKKNDRPEQWLKTVIQWYQKGHRTNELKNGIPHYQYEDFDLLNIRESIIDPDLITIIITEDGAFTTDQFKEQYKELKY